MTHQIFQFYLQNNNLLRVINYLQTCHLQRESMFMSNQNYVKFLPIDQKTNMKTNLLFVTKD